MYLNQGATANEAVTIADQNGFSGAVKLTLSTLPQGVTGTVQGTGTKQRIVLRATAAATTGLNSITVTGTSGSLTNSFTFSLGVSAGVGTTGNGTPVNLSSEFNLNGIYTDGPVYSTGGLAGQGYS